MTDMMLEFREAVRTLQKRGHKIGTVVIGANGSTVDVDGEPLSAEEVIRRASEPPTQSAGAL